jgi:hypothetical protein
MNEAKAPETLYCYRHPDRETSLRCNQCEKPICPSCAVHTPTGYRCKECVQKHQKVYDTAKSMDLVWAVVITGVLAFVGSLLVGVLGYFTLFVAPGIGVLIAEAVRKAVNRRRSKNLFKFVAITCVVASLPLLAWNLIGLLLGMAGGSNFLFLFWGPLWLVYYIITVTTTAYYRLSGRELRRRR